MHPLSRGKDITNEMMEQRRDAMELRFGILSYYYIREREGHASIDVFFSSGFARKKKIKNFRKNLVVKKKCFTFASAFTTKAAVL